MERKEGEPRRGQAALVFSEVRACFVFCGLPPSPVILSVLSGFVQGLRKSKNKIQKIYPDCDTGDLKWFNLSIYLQSNTSAHTLDVFIIFVKKKSHVW